MKTHLHAIEKKKKKLCKTATESPLMYKKKMKTFDKTLQPNSVENEIALYPLLCSAIYPLR